MQDNEFGLRTEQENDEEGKRHYHLNPGEWTELASILYHVVRHEAAFSVYTSRDRSALCIAVKHGEDRTADWIGPDDSPFDILNGIADKWGIRRGPTPFQEWVEICVEDDRRSRDAD